MDDVVANLPAAVSGGLLPSQGYRVLVKVHNLDICGDPGGGVGVLSLYGVLQLGGGGLALLVYGENLEPAKDLDSG